MSNYQNRISRGQCVSCSDQTMTNAVRCQTCQEKHRERQRANSESVNAKRRERNFQKAMERERRLEALEIRLEAEVAELEKAFRMRMCNASE
jgi:hypothetical protein